MSTVKTRVVPQGSSASLKFGLSSGDVLIGWTCRVQVREESTKDLILDRVVIDTDVDNLNFITTLDKDDTDLPLGFYIVAAELDNAATSETGESFLLMEIVEDWVY